jgi:hypothetical protein
MKLDKFIDPMPEQKGIPEKNVTPEEKDAVTLSLVEAEDIAPTQEKKPNRIKQVASHIFNTLDSEEQTDKKPRRKRSNFFVKNVALIIGILFFIINLLVPEKYKESFFINEKEYSLLPTNDQLESMVVPLLRIADRHTSIATVNPDVMDIIASSQSVAAYGMELRATILLKKHIEQQEKEKAEQERLTEWRNKQLGSY